MKIDYANILVWNSIYLVLFFSLSAVMYFVFGIGEGKVTLLGILVTGLCLSCLFVIIMAIMDLRFPEWEEVQNEENNCIITDVDSPEPDCQCY